MFSFCSFREFFYALLILMPYCGISELGYVVFVFFSFAWLLLAKKLLVGKSIYVAISPLAILVILGVISSFNNNNFYVIAQDIFYTTKPIFSMIVGYAVADRLKDENTFLRVLGVSSILISCVHLVSVATNISLISGDLEIYRRVVGYGFYSAPLGVAMVYFTIKGKIKVFENGKLGVFILGAISLASLMLSLSRTWLIAVVLIFLVNYKITASVLVRNFFVILFLVTSGLLMVGLVGKQNDQSNETGLGELERKFTESFSSLMIQDLSSENQFGGNWRGFETYKILQNYAEGDAVQYVFGHGFGKLIDMGIYFYRGADRSEEYREKNISHNGYFWMLLKTGAVGFSILIYFMWRNYRYAKRYKREVSDGSGLVLASLCLGTAMVNAISTYVWMGIFHPDYFSLNMVVLGGGVYFGSKIFLKKT